MDREYIEHFKRIVELKRDELGLSQEKMSSLLGMPLATYKTMLSGTMVNLSVSVLVKAEEITGLSIYELIGVENPDLKMLEDFRKLPEHRKRSIRSTIEVEWELSKSLPESDHSIETICYEVTGNMEDGMFFDSAYSETIDVGSHQKLFVESIDCAIKITSNHFHPTYHMGCVLLIHQAPPRDGDTGIFIHKPTSKLYIRKFRQTNPCQLIPVNGIGKIIEVDSYNATDMNQWIKFGRV